MSFLTKVAHFFTILMMGYETHNVLENKSENVNNEIIIKTDELFARKFDKDIDSDSDDFGFNKIYIVIIMFVILLVFAVKMYKKCVKDLSSAVITA